MRSNAFAAISCAFLISMGFVQPALAEKSAVAEKAKDPDDPLAGLEYRLLGPLVSGRMTRVSGVAGDPQVFYASAAQGGLWKSTDGGHAFAPIFDAEETQSIGSFALASSDANVIYVGSGEANIRGNVALGYGIWKSEDAGASFSQVLKLRGQIGTMAVHPSNPDIAFAAVLGSPFAAGVERGVYRTQDGGKTWQKVLYINADTGASDVAISTTNPRVVFAGLWQARRTPWALTSGGPGSALQRSADGGDSWSDLDDAAGLPKKPWGKVGVAIAPSNANRVYALIEAKRGGLFRSDDGGLSFTLVNDSRVLRQRAWYYTTMVIAPNNPDDIWFPQVGLVRSKDGGKTLQSVANTGHGDHHDVWIDPKNAHRIIEANDGGVGISTDGGQQWRHPPMPTGQFYNIDVDNRRPYHVGGTMQDMGTASGPSRTLRGAGANLADWRVVGGGEAGDFAYDPKRTGEIYAGEYGGYLSHYSEATRQTRPISIYPANPSGLHASGMKVRFQWTAPIIASNSGALYHGANQLFKSTDQGATWVAISADLTRNDKSKQGWSGGPITGDITTVEYYGTIFSLAEVPEKPGLIYAGTDDGLLHITEDDGKNWRKVTPKGLPEWATIESIHVPNGAPDTVFVAAHNYRLGDDKPYLFKSSNRGASWTALIGSLPDDLTLWAVRTDPEDADYLYLGTQRGVWYSSDAGKSYAPLKMNLPQSTVTDLETKHGDLIVGTRGRAIWVLENLSALRAVAAVQTANLAILPLRDTISSQYEASWGDYQNDDAADEPSDGLHGHFWLKSEFKSTRKNPITLSIFDASGNLVRRLSSTVKAPQYAIDDPDQPSEAPEPDLTGNKGLNAFNWDLRSTGAKRLLGSKLDAGDAEDGPMVPPGRYTLKLQAGDFSSEAAVDVQADPNSTASADDYRNDYIFAQAVIADINRARIVIESARALRAQVLAQGMALKTRASGSARTAEESALQTAGVALLNQLDALEGKVHNPSATVVYDVLAGRDGGAKLYHQLVPLYWLAQSADDAPTQGMQERRVELEAELAQVEASYQALAAKELASYQSALRQFGGLVEPALAR